MEYKYRIFYENIKEHWIGIISDDDFDLEEPDSFVHFIKMIQLDVNGKLENIGWDQFKIDGDGVGFIYQWDGLFGISVIYPDEISHLKAIDFLSRYMSDF